jgi:hypothetical protein
MPKTAVYEHRYSDPRKHDVGLSAQCDDRSFVHKIPKSSTVQLSP